MAKSLFFRRSATYLVFAILPIFSDHYQALSTVSVDYVQKNILIAGQSKEKDKTPCSPSATEKEFLDEVARLNGVLDKIEIGKISEDYLPLAAYNNVMCLSLREDDERLKAISAAAMEQIEQSSPEVFGTYAFHLYNAISESQRRINGEKSAKIVLARAWSESLRRKDYSSAISVGNFLLYSLSTLKDWKSMLVYADELIKISSYRSPKIADSWRQWGYFVLSSAVEASEELGDHISKINYAEKGLQVLEDAGQEISSLDRIAYLHIVIANSYGHVENPDMGLEKISQLEAKIGGLCSQATSKLSPDYRIGCTKTKIWLYVQRSIDSLGIDSRLSIADARMALKLDPSENLYLENLADVLFFSQQKSNTQEALVLYEKLLTMRSIDQDFTKSEWYFRVKNRIAACLNELDRHPEALEIITQSLAQSRAVFGNDSEIVVQGKWLKALINYNLGKVDEGVSRAVEHQIRLERAAKISDKNPSLFLSDNLLLLAGIRLDQGNYFDAVSLAEESISEKVSILRGKIHLLPTDSRQEFASFAFGDVDAIYSFSGVMPAAAELALFARLNFHGLTEEIAKLQQSQLSLRPELAQKVVELRNIDSQISAIGIPWRMQAKLIARKKILEKDIYSNLEIKPIQAFTVRRVARALPKNAALVEIKKFRRWFRNMPRSQRWGEYEYQALVLTPDSKVIAVPLGSSALIDAKLDHALKKSTFTSSGSLQEEGQVYDAWKKLFSSTLSPIAQSIPGVKQIFLSPDGELHKVPWSLASSSLVSDSSSLQINLITTGRELVLGNEEQFWGQPSKSVVIADPSFNDRRMMSSTARPSGIRSTLRAEDLDSSTWLQLPFTLAEGRAISEILKAELVTGVNATTLQIKSISRPEYLHVATHGFFLENKQSSRNPMLLSGLVFAGANTSQVGFFEDPYLTALEAASLDLRGTKLVVLSACSTAQGVSRNGEGVYGLRRSLKVAGSNASILSLWKVDDAATAYLMKLLYKGLENGLPVQIALAEAQRSMKDGPVPAWRHPYYWLAWQLVGGI